MRAVKAAGARRSLSLLLALGLVWSGAPLPALAAQASRAPGVPTTLTLPALPVSPSAGEAAVEAAVTGADVPPPVLEPVAGLAPAAAAAAVSAAVGGSPIAASAASASEAAAPSASADQAAAEGRVLFDHQSASREVTFVYDAGDREDVSGVHLAGNFDKVSGAYDEGAWPQLLPMKRGEDGRWTATVSLRDDGRERDWRWGAVVDTRERPRQWGVMEEAPLLLRLDPASPRQTASYAPTTFHAMGATRSGSDDLSFRLWAPDARKVDVKLIDARTRAETVHALTRDEDGIWSSTLPGAWKTSLGDAYVYRVTTSDGRLVERADPYARVMQGKQRGITQVYVDADTAEQVQPFYFQNAGKKQAPLTRFELQERRGEPLGKAFLVLKYGDGRPLTKAQVLARFGDGDAKLARAFGASYWSGNVEPDGRIRLAPHRGAWAVLFDQPDRLLGLRYELQAFTTGGKPASDKNDRWSDVIEPSSGKSFRGSIVADDSYAWKWDSAPRERNRAKWRFYQLHVGSFMGRDGDIRRSTFDDVRRKLALIKWLGFNAVQLMPTGESEDVREWRYTGANSLAAESTHGFDDEQGRPVDGLQAEQAAIDEAHHLGLNVVGDVVYNHIGGKYGPDWRISAVAGSDNHLWGYDGPENPYFNWAPSAAQPEIRHTPWGPLPAYNQPRARQLLLDHLAFQFQKLHFDGLRLDFTNPIKTEGGAAGWGLLRQVRRLASFINPFAFLAAEQFPYDAALTQPQKADGSGAGFDALWYTEFNHLLVHEADASKPSILQEAAAGAKTVMDRFMNMLTNPFGIESWAKAVAPITNHDEVGAGGRVINIANGERTDALWPQFARDAWRFSMGVGLVSPGMPMIFQGEASMADNLFRWGLPSTWDLENEDWLALGPNWDWSAIRFNDGRKALYEGLAQLAPAQREAKAEASGLSASEKALTDYVAGLPAAERTAAWRAVARRQAAEFTRAANALRASSDAFDADAAVERVYTHNDHSVVAFTRKAGADEFLIIGSLNRAAWKSYGLALPPGPWTEVFTSDAERFGGSGVSNAGRAIPGGWSRVDIPSAGFVVLKKAR